MLQFGIRAAAWSKVCTVAQKAARPPKWRVPTDMPPSVPVDAYCRFPQPPLFPPCPPSPPPRPLLSIGAWNPVLEPLPLPLVSSLLTTSCAGLEPSLQPAAPAVSHTSTTTRSSRTAGVMRLLLKKLYSRNSVEGP